MATLTKELNHSHKTMEYNIPTGSKDGIDKIMTLLSNIPKSNWSALIDS
ncbi:MAG: hypothetical protein VX693_00815 [Pseudomonadota bacterium]|nr:hypothetical protein [Pseudomonadota bacterium]